MAITNIPTIQGPDFGGVIYGLNMKASTSAEPAQLTINIVNENGNYRAPSLNSTDSISFGNFRFNGTLWSYSIDQSAAEKTLQVTYIDNSIILDRYYVILWKRGLFGINGSSKRLSRTYNFNNESVLIPTKGTNPNYPFTKFKEVTLGAATVESFSYEASRKIGNCIVLGTEKFANSVCDIPDTYYTFDDLKKELQGIVQLVNAPSNRIWKATHEGTLREVLSSWCSDLGYDFYWDWSRSPGRVVFYAITRGINPSMSNVNSNASNIISKKMSSSMEGTFRQYGIGYTAQPKSAVKTLSENARTTILYSISPYPISYFVSKAGEKRGIDNTGGSKWGKKRNESSFLESAFLGYVCRSLRDLYCFQNEYWEALGYEIGSGQAPNKKQLLNALKKFGFQDMVSDLEAFDAKDLPNYDFNFISRDQTLGDRWHETEQQMLTYLGKYYRHADISGTIYYCSRNATAEINITVDPETQLQETDSEEFAGKRIINRGGEFSHDQSSARELLQYNRLVNEIQNCAPIHIDLKESGILDALISAKLLTGQQSKKINTLVIFPNSNKFVKEKIGFTSSLSTGVHPLEKTIEELVTSNQKNGKKNCPKFEETLAQNSCQSAEEKARNIALKNAGVKNETEDRDKYISGLINKRARVCTIKLKTGNVKIFAPSTGPLQVVCNYDITVNKISKVGTDPFVWSSGTPGRANDVAEIRISMENITDPNEDSYRNSRKPGQFIKPENVDGSSKMETIDYVFAGEPKGVSMTPEAGLSNIDINLSSEGFKTSVQFRSRPPKAAKADTAIRRVQSQFNRSSFNSG